MALDLNKIRAHYAKMDLFKLEQIAKYEIRALEPEVIDIVKDEVKKRGLDYELLEMIDLQSQEMTLEQLSDIVFKLKSLPCPTCNQQHAKIKGGYTRRVMSFVVFTQSENQPKIMCSDCLAKAQNVQILQTLALGWWCFPWGIIRTFQALFNYGRDKGTASEKRSEEIMNGVAYEYSSDILMNWENENELIYLLRYLNKGMK